MTEHLRGLTGVAVMCGIAWLLSSNKRRFPLKTVVGGFALQVLLAFLVLRTESGRAFFDAIAQVVTVILNGADQGAKFVFGALAGGDPGVPWQAVAGIKILTTIITVATLSSLGYHYGILQQVVRGMAWVMTRIMGITGPESLSGAANVFLGQTEAPLLVRPFLPTMTRSELMAVMSGGFATISAGVMAYYVTLLGIDSEGHASDVQKTIMARHLLTASLMSAPAAFMLAKIMVPPGDEARPTHLEKVITPIETRNGLDAAAVGASEGMKLAINVMAMLIAFIALIAVLDSGLAWIGRMQAVEPYVHAAGLQVLNLDGILGLLFSPIAYLNGIDWNDCRSFGGLLGKAMATNEMLAYSKLSDLIRGNGLSERSIVIATYSLCGFANFSSIGIQIGGIGALAPSRRNDLVDLGPRAMLAGAMASWMTGCIAGVML